MHGMSGRMDARMIPTPSPRRINGFSTPLVSCLSSRLCCGCFAISIRELERRDNNLLLEGTVPLLARSVGPWLCRSNQEIAISTEQRQSPVAPGVCISWPGWVTPPRTAIGSLKLALRRPSRVVPSTEAGVLCSAVATQDTTPPERRIPEEPRNPTGIRQASVRRLLLG